MNSPPQTPSATKPLLSMNDIDISFGGVAALRKARLAVNPGEVHALIGQNGAGKSTLIKIMAGVVALDTGRISYDGRDYTNSARQMPISFIHQDLDQR